MSVLWVAMLSSKARRAMASSPACGGDPRPHQGLAAAGHVGAGEVCGVAEEGRGAAELDRAIGSAGFVKHAAIVGGEGEQQAHEDGGGTAPLLAQQPGG